MGKGDTYRKVDMKKYSENYEKIFGKKMFSLDWKILQEKLEKGLTEITEVSNEDIKQGYKDMLNNKEEPKPFDMKKFKKRIDKMSDEIKVWNENEPYNPRSG